MNNQRFLGFIFSITDLAVFSALISLDSQNYGFLKFTDKVVYQRESMGVYLGLLCRGLPTKRT